MQLNQKLSFTLGFRSLALLVVLGVVMAVLQTFVDFRQREAEITQTISSIITSAKSSASNAVYLLEPRMAEDVIEGLAYFNYFNYVAIIDDQGNIMAQRQVDGRILDQVSAQTADSLSDNSTYNSFLSLFIEHYTKTTVPLMEAAFQPNKDGNYGKMLIVVDNHLALKGVYDRAVKTFGITMGAYVFLTLALILLYHYSLAAPLVRLSKRFQRVNTKSISSQKISHLKGHNKNEFSLIVNAANEMLSRISQAQVLLTERSQRFRLILDTAPALIYSLDSELNFVFANKATAGFYGFSIYDLKGKNANEIIKPIDHNIVELLNDFICSNKRQVGKTVSAKGADDVLCHLEITAVKFKTPEGHSILVTATDVSKRVDAEHQIESLAYYDALTSLPNRNTVYKVLKQEQESTDKYSIVAIADLDQFKRINDTLSHSVGDDLIQNLANRLKGEFAFSDLIARLGADEFLCIEENVSKDIEVANTAAKALGERLRKCINEKIQMGMQHYTLSASIGVMVFKKNHISADEILQYTDTAMYESKRAGRNRVTLFKDDMATQAAELLSLEQDIMKAMLRDEFYFVLQAIVSSLDQSLQGAEALIRWAKDDSVVSPDEFIPFLEDSSLIVEVGEQIFRKVCQFIAKVEKQNLLPKHFKVAVNISAKQLARPDFINMISTVLADEGVAPTRIELEITESAALNDMQDTIQKIESIKKMGISFSLDDFGTGYSSLSQLKDLPVDKLKIDRSFINDITVDKQDENLVRSIMQISTNLGLTTVAEGVETKEQMQWLKINGEILLQGYYFSRPLEPADFVEKYLHKH